MNKNVAVADLSSKPVRRGTFFGSAACCRGRLCTLAAFEQATAEARELRNHLGPGWKAHVWENLGWHYRVTLGSGENVMYVSARTNGSHIKGGWKVTGYGASFNYQPWHDHSTPEGAVIQVIAAMRAQMDDLEATLATATRLVMPLLPAPAPDEALR